VYEKLSRTQHCAITSATGNPMRRRALRPAGGRRASSAPPNDIEAIKTATANNPNVVAVF
jgi:acetylornithine aminotransferase